jgi:hypothetical protein
LDAAKANRFPPSVGGRIDQKQSVERPEGLAAEALFALLIDHDDAFAGVGDFRRGDEARQPAADHDYVCIACHRVIPGPAHDPPRRERFGAKIMRHLIFRARSDAKPPPTFADRAPGLKPAALTTVNGKWPPELASAPPGKRQGVPLWDLSAERCSPHATLNLNLF